MKYLVHILLAVVALIGGVLQEAGAEVRVHWMPLLLGLPYATTALWRYWAVRRGFRTATHVARISQYSGVIAFGISLGFLGWVDWVRGWAGQALRYDDWPDWGLVVCFAPFVAFQVAAIHAEALVERGSLSPVLRKVRLEVRSLFAAMSPLALYMLVSVVSARSEVWRVNIESVELFGGMYFLGITVLLGAFMPTLLSNTWDTSPLPQGPARQLFEDVASQAAFKARKVLLWKTDNMVANAAIVGMSSRFRIVLLSDSLLSMLGARELACVYGHEIGHAKRHHVPIFIGWSVFFLLGGDLLIWALMSPEGLLGFCMLAGILALWYVCFGWLSRRFELEADLFSMKLTGDPEALIQALERVGGGNRDRGGWRHFSTARRVTFLHRAAFDEVFKMRFLRRIRLLGRAGLVLGGCVGFMYLGSLVQRLEGDRLHVHLALGNYEATWTAEQAPKGPQGKEFGVLLEAAASLANPEGDRVPLDRLRSVLREALQAGEFTEARSVARLLDVRRVVVARQLVRAMNQWPFPPLSEAELVDWPEPWREFGLQGLLLLRN
ncbi:MAG: Zn-dependent protease with chaperone function [Planctomycetota bacterium]|jgi:Zn-dependent protease with chaperone function